MSDSPKKIEDIGECENFGVKSSCFSRLVATAHGCFAKDNIRKIQNFHEWMYSPNFLLAKISAFLLHLN